MYEEAYDLTDGLVEDISPSKSTRPDAQTWYVSSAPHDTSAVLRQVCLAGRAGDDPAMAYFEWCADDDADPDDDTQVAKANPAYGIRISSESVADDRAEMSPEGYARELPSTPSGGPPSPSQDASRTATWWCRSSTGVKGWIGCRAASDSLSTGGGRWWWSWTPGPVPSRCSRPLPTVGCISPTARPGPSGGGGLVIETTSRDMGQAAVGFEDGILDRRLVHVDQGILNAGRDGARRRT